MLIMFDVKGEIFNIKMYFVACLEVGISLQMLKASVPVFSILLLCNCCF